MGKLTWVRPSGTEITTNDSDETIATAAKLGWVPKDQANVATQEPSADSPRRGRPKKAE